MSGFRALRDLRRFNVDNQTKSPVEYFGEGVRCLFFAFAARVRADNRLSLAINVKSLILSMNLVTAGASAAPSWRVGNRSGFGSDPKTSSNGENPVASDFDMLILATTFGRSSGQFACEESTK
jgi:hypothetical protein